LSTEPFVRPRAAVRRAGVVLVATWAVTGARGAEVDFRPAMTFGVFHDGNISVTGGTHGDDGANLAFDLAVDRKNPMSMFSFSYRPSYVAYRKASDLDYLGNTVVLGFVRDESRASRFTLNAYVTRTDYQGLTQDTKDRATTFVPRTTLSQATLKLAGTRAVGRRGFIDWQLRGGVDRYKDLPDNPATTGVVDPVNFNDATAYGGRLAWRSELTVRNTLGVALDGAHFGYEFSPSINVESIGLVGTSSLSESWMLDYSVGATRAESDVDSISGFSFDAKLEYQVERGSTFSAGARQVFAPGTGLGGPTQDRGVWIAYAHAPTARGLSGSVLGGYWQRDELEFATGTTTTSPPADSASYTVNGSIGWRFNRFIGVDGAYAFIHQSARNVADPVLASSLNSSYSSYALYLRWAIRGR
jgi:hypothetical protein